MSDKVYAEFAKYGEQLDELSASMEPFRDTVAKLDGKDAVSAALMRAFDEELGRYALTLRSIKKGAQAATATGKEMDPALLQSLAPALFQVRRCMLALDRELKILPGELLAFKKQVEAHNAAETAKRGA